jgi:hypothetical protein
MAKQDEINALQHAAQKIIEEFEEHKKRINEEIHQILVAAGVEEVVSAKFQEVEMKREEGQKIVSALVAKIHELENEK